MRNFLICLLVFPVLAFAQQPLVPSTNTLQYGNVFSNAPSTLPLTIDNPTQTDVLVKKVKLFNYYGLAPFTTLDSQFTVTAGQSKIVNITFAPQQNMPHQMYAVFTTNSGKGDFAVSLVGQGKYNSNYWAGSENLEGEPLKQALRARIAQGAFNLGYNTVRDQMFMTVDNKRVNGQAATTNTLECVYTGRIITGYASRTAAQNSPNSFNTEHTWPQSQGADNDPMQSDMHHLYPVDGAANSVRSNDPFAVLTNFTWSQGGSKSNGSAFEPRDAHKGKAARSILYFATRYGATTGVNIGFLTGQEAILRIWNEQFLPTQIDIKRNNDIYGLQFNRNPWVDFPYMLRRISSLSSTATVLPTRSFDISSPSIEYGFVNTGTTSTFELVLVNTGNQILNLNNFNISGSEFSFPNGFGNDTLIGLNAHIVFKVNYNPTSTVPANGTLTFGSNAGGTNFHSIPLVGNTNIGTGTYQLKQFKPLTVYPNPMVSDWVTVAPEFSLQNNEYVVMLTDVLGRNIPIAPIKMQNQLLINVESLNSGVYTLTLIHKNTNTFYTSRLVK